MRIGVQPGSFDPPTLAHLAIAWAALRHHDLDRVVWTVSRRPLGKDAGRTDVEARLDVLRAVAARLGLEVPDDVRLDVPGWVARQSSTDALHRAPWTALSAARASGLWSGLG